MTLFSGRRPLTIEPRYGPSVRAEPIAGPVETVHIGAPASRPRTANAGLIPYKLTRIGPRTPGEWLVLEDLPPQIANRQRGALLTIVSLSFLVVIVGTVLRQWFGVATVPIVACGVAAIILTLFVLPFLCAVRTLRSVLRVVSAPDARVLELCEAYEQAVTAGSISDAQALHEQLWAIAEQSGQTEQAVDRDR